jgi:hypothetical protein
LKPKRATVSTATVVEENLGEPFAYTSWNKAERTRVDIGSHPLLDDEQREIPLYTRAGFPLKRIRLYPAASRDPPALLADLSRMHNVFERDAEGLGDDFRPSPMYAFPQAFTKYGNVQSPQPMAIFQDRIACINARVRSTRPDAGWPIECLNFQGYNYESHRTRASASTHAAQTAPLTTMLTGTMRYPSPNTKWTNAVNRYRSSGMLPFQDLEAKILESDAKIGAQFRKEVVYQIDMDELNSGIRKSGGSVLRFHSPAPADRSQGALQGSHLRLGCPVVAWVGR